MTVAASMNFSSLAGMDGGVYLNAPDKTLSLTHLRAYNDWHLDEWCGAYPDRFIPCGILPLFDVHAAAAEVRRLAGKGCHAATFSENPAGLGMPSIHRMSERNMSSLPPGCLVAAIASKV